MKLLRRCIWGSLGLFLSTCAVQAQTTYSWLASGGGTYETPGNWAPLGGPPGPIDTANFGLSGTYTVNFTNGTAPNIFRTTDHFTVQNGSVTFNYSLSTANYKFNSLSTITAIGAAPSASLTLTNTGSQGMTGNGLLVGITANKQGTFIASTNSVWNDLGDITAGSGGSGVVIATGGGKINSVNGVLGQLGGTGTGVVTGANSQWNLTGDLNVGQSATGTSSLLVQLGGKVNANNIYTASVSNSVANLTVQDANSVLTSNNLTIGSNGAGTLTISNGGHVVGASGTVGLGNVTSTATVTGNGSLWTMTGNLEVAWFANASLLVQNGGDVVSNGGRLGIADGSKGTATVTGVGSTWNTSGASNFVVGQSGTGNITISNGGAMTSTTATLALFGAANGSVTVTDSGSMWTITNGLFVGSEGTGSLTITNGGKVTMGNNAFIQVGSITGSSGSLSIIGTGSNLTMGNAGSLSVGPLGNGTLLVTNGGTLNTTTGFLGSTFGGNGTATVTGLNSLWTLSSEIYLGGDFTEAGGTGTLNLNNLGKVTTGSSLTLWGGGTLNLNGGTLSTQSIFFNGGVVNWNAGTVNFTQTTNLNDALLNNLVGSAHVLGQNRTLSTSAGANFTVGTALTVDGGRLNSGGSLTVATGQQLVVQNGGQVTAPTSVSNFGTIQMNGSTTQFNGGSIDNQGIITGSGRVNNTLSNNVNGQVRVGPSDWLVFTGASHSSQGSIQLLGGTLEFTGFLNNGGAGFVSGYGTLLTSTAAQGGLGLVNTGTYAFSGGNTNIFGDVQNNVGGKIITSGGSVTTFHDDVIHNGSEIRTSGGARTVFFGSVSGAGPYTGTGVVHYEGDLRPGNSPANVTYDGDIEFSSTAKLHIELGGTTPGSQYDRLTVAGSVTLSGLLDVQAINGFIPNIGQSFIIIDNLGLGAINGTFSGLNQGDFFTSGGIGYQIDYHGNTGNDVVLTAMVAVPEPTTWALVGLTLLCTGGVYWQRRRQMRQGVEQFTE